MKRFAFALLIGQQLLTAQTHDAEKEQAAALKACGAAALAGFRQIADTRESRFTGKVSDSTALCRGGYKAEQFRFTPWVDWSNYWGTGDMQSLPKGFVLGS